MPLTSLLMRKPCLQSLKYNANVSSTIQQHATQGVVSGPGSAVCTGGGCQTTAARSETAAAACLGLDRPEHQLIRQQPSDHAQLWRLDKWRHSADDQQ